jgi:hypothetical protein
MRHIATLLFILLSLTAHGQSFVFYGNSGRSLKTWHGQMDVQSLNFEYAHPLSSRTELGFVLSPMSIVQPKSWFGEQFNDGDERVRAISASLLLRRRFHLDSQRVQFYGEVGTGPMLAEKAVPASTSRFNFLTQFGMGVVLRPATRTPIVAGYRFEHISNGGYSPRNPGLNVSALVFGVRIATPRRR